VISQWRLAIGYLAILGVGGGAIVALDASGLLDRPKGVGYWEFLLAACLIFVPLALMLAFRPLLRVRPPQEGETLAYHAADGSSDSI
jgi:ABC-type Fe3+ transport system permease subunit